MLIFRLPCRDFPAIAVPSCKLPLPIADTVDELHYDRDDEDKRQAIPIADASASWHFLLLLLLYPLSLPLPLLPLLPALL